MRAEAIEITPSPSEPFPCLETERKPRGHILEIQGLKPREIAYNPARPMTVLDPRTGRPTTLLPIRVESENSHFERRDGIYNPHIDLAKPVGDGTWRIIDAEYWKVADTLRQFQGLEDPAQTSIGDEIVITGVRAISSGDGKAKTTTEVFAGPNLQSLKQVAEIEGKDNRFCQLPDGRILFASRPQGAEAGLGRIALTIIKSLKDLRSNFHNVPILKDQVPEESWVGANEIQVTYTNGHIEVGILGHIATHDPNGNRHYASMAFTVRNAGSVDRQRPITTPIKIISRASDLPQTGAKAPDLEDIDFPGALIRTGPGRALLFLGKNDWRVAVDEIPDPFRR